MINESKKFDDMFDSFDPVDIVLSLDDGDIVLGEEADILNEEDIEPEDIEEYDEADDVAIGIDDVASEEFRRARDCGWETQIDDDVEDAMMDDEDIEDEDDVEFNDGWPDT